MFKFSAVLVLLMTSVWAQGNKQQEEINFEMCGSHAYRFDLSSMECIYCAHGLTYDHDLKCVGTPDVLGKCDGDHHYHAATEECMFCAKGSEFNEVSRGCEITKKQ